MPSIPRRLRVVTALLAAITLGLVSTAMSCTREQVEAYLALDAETRLIVDGALAAHAADTEARFYATLAERERIRRDPFLVCVRRHESDSAGGYAAQNPYSSASGAYQFIDSTWRTASARAGHPGYARALHAPDWVQDAVAYHMAYNGGRSAWAGTGCPGT